MELKNLKRFYQDPYKVMLFSLVFLVLVNCNFVGGLSVLESVLFIVLVSILTDSLIGYAESKRFYISETALISGLVLSLVISPQTPLFYLLGAPLLAQVSKHIIRYKNKPVFNPAAFGMFFIFLFFPAGEAWWGNSIALLALILGLCVSYRIDRLLSSFSFLISFLVFNSIRSFFAGSMIQLLSLAALASSQFFFAFFMIVEPKSSTSNQSGKIICGTAAGLFTIVGFILGLPTPFFIGLFTSNLIALYFK